VQRLDDTVRRVRACVACGQRYLTVERVLVKVRAWRRVRR
jgi:transcriptional regulator NrdR family protein